MLKTSRKSENMRTWVWFLLLNCTRNVCISDFYLTHFMNKNNLRFFGISIPDADIIRHFLIFCLELYQIFKIEERETIFSVSSQVPSQNWLRVQRETSPTLPFYIISSFSSFFIRTWEFPKAVRLYPAGRQWRLLTGWTI